MHRKLTPPVLLISGALAAQNACDSLYVDTIRYAPFGDGLHVILNNESTQFLSGPTVDVLESDGDTIAVGVQQFFGIMPGSSLHQVYFTPQPSTPFTGIIQVNYYDMNGWVHCARPVSNMDLCPPIGCVPLQAFAYQQGGNPVAMDLDWNVTDANNDEQAGGVLHMDGTGFGYVVSDLCLTPGAYTLHVSQPVAAGTTIQVGMTQANFAYTDGVMAQLPIGGSVDLPFNYYEHCAEGTEGITTQQLQAPTLMIDGRVLKISSSDGSTLGTMLILDNMGRAERTISTNSSSASIDLGDLSSGAYILRTLSVNNWPAQRFILN